MQNYFAPGLLSGFAHLDGTRPCKVVPLFVLSVQIVLRYTHRSKTSVALHESMNNIAYSASSVSKGWDLVFLNLTETCSSPAECVVCAQYTSLQKAPTCPLSTCSHIHSLTYTHTNTHLKTKGDTTAPRQKSQSGVREINVSDWPITRYVSEPKSTFLIVAPPGTLQQFDFQTASVWLRLCKFVT